MSLSFRAFLILLMLSSAALADDSRLASVMRSDRHVLAPIVQSSPSFGDGAGLTGFWFYRPDGSPVPQPAPGPNGRPTPPSRLFAVGAYSNTDSYFAALGNTTYRPGDTARFTAEGAFGLVNNEFDDFMGGTARFGIRFKGARLNYLWETFDRLYVGPQLNLQEVEYEPEDQFTKDYLERVGAEDNTTRGVTLVANRDTRDNQLYPHSGTLTEFSYTANLDALGSDFDYDVLKTSFNAYDEWRPGHVIAGRAYGYFALGDTTYSGKARLGGGSDLRGYVAGEIVGENLVSVQAEYRWRVTRPVGLAFFGGMACIYDGSVNDFDSDCLYGSFGAGFRIRLQEEQRVNLRIDFAKGDGDDGYYVSIREAF